MSAGRIRLGLAACLLVVAGGCATVDSTLEEVKSWMPAGPVYPCVDAPMQDDTARKVCRDWIRAHCFPAMSASGERMCRESFDKL